MKSEKIIGFDAIRAISVLLVIASHVGIIEEAKGVFRAFFLVFNASFGVRAFFALSGFLITTLLLQEAKASGTISIPKFIARRALRIFPLYYLVIGILLASHHLGWIGVHGTTFVYAATYTYNYVPVDYNSHFLSHLWSLSVEEQFYIAWPLVVLALFRKPVMFMAATVLMTGGLIFSVATYGGGRGFIPAAYPILLGSACAIATFYSGWFAQLCRSNTLLLIATFSILAPLLVGPDKWQVEVIGASGITGLISWIYLNQENRFVQKLNWSPIVVIGQISYGLYVWQGLLTGNGPYREFAHFPPPPVVGALLTFPVAIASFYLFERPILKLKKWFTPSRT